MKNKNSRHTANLFRGVPRKYSLVLAGAIIQGFAMGVFLFPNYIPSGGAGGFTVLLNYWFELPLSISLFIVNASMLLFAFHYLGGGSAIGTLVGITVTSISVNIFNVYVESPFKNVWIDLLVGSLFLGTGIAILYRQRVSNGGVGVIALIIAKYKDIDPSKSLFWINGVIFVFTAYVIDWQIVIQALICQWVSTKTVGWLYNVHIPRKRLIFEMVWRRNRYVDYRA